MAGKTDQTKLQFLFKKLLGKANTSNLKGDAEEGLGSAVQLAGSQIFADNIPNAPTVALNTISSHTVECLILTATAVPGSTYDANDAGGGGDGSQNPGPHSYYFHLNRRYNENSVNKHRGLGFFTSGMALSASNGALQLVPPVYSSQSPNPYQIKIYEDDGSGGLGDEISLLDEVDWYCDYYNGILFLQDYDSTKIPKFVKAFMYVGDKSIEKTRAVTVSGSYNDGNINRYLLLSGSGNPVSGQGHHSSDKWYVGDPLYYTDTSFYVSGAMGTKAGISGITGGAGVFGGDVVISGSTYIESNDMNRSEMLNLTMRDNFIGPKITLKAAGDTPIDDQAVGTISFDGHDSGGGDAGYAMIHASTLDVSAGTEAGKLELKVAHEGFTPFTYVTVQGGEGAPSSGNQARVSIGAVGLGTRNCDFQVSTKNKHNAIFTDSDKNQVLIHSGGGVTSPNEGGAIDMNFFVSGSKDAKGEDVKGTAVFGGDTLVSGTLYIDNSGATVDNYRGLKFLNNSTEQNGYFVIDLRPADNPVNQGGPSSLTMQNRLGGVAVGIGSGSLEHSPHRFIITEMANPGQGSGWGGASLTWLQTSSSLGGQVLILSGGGVTSPNYAMGRDITFYVSGTVGSRGSGNDDGGMSVFGGDVLVSGTLYDSAGNSIAGGTPGGSNTQIQFNDSNSFQGSSNLTWDGTKVAISNTATTDSFLITTTEASADAGPVITLKRNSANPANADAIGQIKFKGEDDGDNEVTYAKITGKISDVADSGEDGKLLFTVMSDGTQTITARVEKTGLTALSHLNLGLTSGDSGYGFRDNSGTIEFKNNGGGWSAVGSGGGGGGGSSNIGWLTPDAAVGEGPYISTTGSLGIDMSSDTQIPVAELEVGSTTSSTILVTHGTNPGDLSGSIAFRKTTPGAGASPTDAALVFGQNADWHHNTEQLSLVMSATLGETVIKGAGGAHGTDWVTGSIYDWKQGTLGPQILFLSGNTGAGGHEPGASASSPDPRGYKDTNFWVSGSAFHKGTSAADSSRGVAVFGGDVVTSGSLYAQQELTINAANKNPAQLSTRTVGIMTLTLDGGATPTAQTIDTYTVSDSMAVKYFMSISVLTASGTPKGDRATIEMLISNDGASNSANPPVFTENRAHTDYNASNSKAGYLDSVYLPIEVTQDSGGTCTVKVKGSAYWLSGTGNAGTDNDIKVRFERTIIRT